MKRDLDLAPQMVLNSAELEDLRQRACRAGIEELSFAAGAVIFREGQVNTALYLLVEGEAGLYQGDDSGTSVLVDRLGAGSFLGLISFWTGNATFSRSIAETDLLCLRMEKGQMEEFARSDAGFNRLLIANLADRYRRMVRLNLNVAALSRALEEERNQLQDALEELGQARTRLIHGERLATMGQLLAGIAHEINNPAGALERSVDAMVKQVPALADDMDIQALLLSGLAAGWLESSESQARIAELAGLYPELPRSLLRRLVLLPQADMARVDSELKRAADGAQTQRLVQLLDAFECGLNLRTTRLSCERIVSLVRSLRSYGRPDGDDDVSVDIGECVHDTLTVLNHRLKHYNVSVDIGKLPTLRGSAAELNQVLTNLLVNACEATPPGGELSVHCYMDAGQVVIEVADTGHGIDADKIEQVFEPNFTTKRSGTGFGLGLGLAIAKDIVCKHGGSISVKNRSGGGACFTIRLGAGGAPP